jgi:hypothetical protein
MQRITCDPCLYSITHATETSGSALRFLKRFQKCRKCPHVNVPHLWDDVREWLYSVSRFAWYHVLKITDRNQYRWNSWSVDILHWHVKTKSMWHTLIVNHKLKLLPVPSTYLVERCIFKDICNRDKLQLNTFCWGWDEGFCYSSSTSHCTEF